MKDNNNTKVVFEDKYFNFLKEKSKKEFRSLKATIEMIVVQYIQDQFEIKDDKKIEKIKRKWGEEALLSDNKKEEV